MPDATTETGRGRAVAATTQTAASAEAAATQTVVPAAAEAVEIEPGSAPVDVAVSVEAAPPSAPAAAVDDKARLKVWAALCVLSFGVALAVFVLQHIYFDLPFVAAGFFLAALMPGFLLSLHVLLQDCNLGVDELMAAAGDEEESCGFRSVLRMWAQANAANVLLFLAIAIFSSGWLIAVLVDEPSRVKNPYVSGLLVIAVLSLGAFFLYAARAGRRAVEDLEKLEANPPTAAVHVLAPPPTAGVELVGEDVEAPPFPSPPGIDEVAGGDVEAPAVGAPPAPDDPASPLPPSSPWWHVLDMLGLPTDDPAADEQVIEEHVADLARICFPTAADVAERDAIVQRTAAEP